MNFEKLRFSPDYVLLFIVTCRSLQVVLAMVVPPKPWSSGILYNSARSIVHSEVNMEEVSISGNA